MFMHELQEQVRTAVLPYTSMRAGLSPAPISKPPRRLPCQHPGSHFAAYVRRPMHAPMEQVLLDDGIVAEILAEQVGHGGYIEVAAGKHIQKRFSQIRIRVDGRMGLVEDQYAGPSAFFRLTRFFADQR